VTVTEIRCSRQNYGGLRSVPVKYIVVHYTGVANDRAINNARYFASADTGKTSAHYFVDEREIIRSVPEAYVAYHCGGKVYHHPNCRNANSIGVEICTKGDGETFWFAEEALENAKQLIRELMDRYDVPPENVIRHYDVTHKLCPMPFVGKGQAAWEAFKGGLVMYKKVDDVPEWAKPTVEKIVEKGYLQGDEKENLNLSADLTRMLVILDRAGVFG